VISGSPSRGELEEARMKLVSEFAEISGNNGLSSYNDTLKTYYIQRNAISGMQLAAGLVMSGKYDASIEFLNANGIKCTAPGDEREKDALLRLIGIRLKNMSSKFKQTQTRYELLSKEGEKPTRMYYNRLMIALSTCEAIKMQLNMREMTVAEFAGYINLFNEYQKQLKNKAR
jgi:hypothetical protein